MHVHAELTLHVRVQAALAGDHTLNSAGSEFATAWGGENVSILFALRIGL